MSSLRTWALVIALGAAGAAGCAVEETACTTEFRYGVNVSVRDARDGSAITNATVQIVDGTYTETLMQPALPGSYAGAGERAGAYTLTVTAPGFQPAAPRALTVGRTADGCHVQGVSVTIDLTPL